MNEYNINGKPTTIGEVSSDLVQVYHRTDIPPEIKQLCTDAHLLIVMMASQMAKAGILKGEVK